MIVIYHYNFYHFFLYSYSLIQPEEAQQPYFDLPQPSTSRNNQPRSLSHGDIDSKSAEREMDEMRYRREGARKRDPKKKKHKREDDSESVESSKPGKTKKKSKKKLSKEEPDINENKEDNMFSNSRLTEERCTQDTIKDDEVNTSVPNDIMMKSISQAKVNMDTDSHELNDELPVYTEPVHQPKIANLRSPSSKSVTSFISADGTLKASDSSISTRQSNSPPKLDITNNIEDITENKLNPSMSQLTISNKIYKESSGRNQNKKTSKDNLLATTNDNEYDKANIKESVPMEIDTPTDNSGENKKVHSSESNSSSVDLSNETTKQSAKGDSLESSTVSSPTRSRTGSESSNDSRPARRSNSTLASKAAMWDSMCKQSKEKPTQPEKQRKHVRAKTSGLMDLSQRFEVKPPSKKPKIVASSSKVRFSIGIQCK